MPTTTYKQLIHAIQNRKFQREALRYHHYLTILETIQSKPRGKQQLTPHHIYSTYTIDDKQENILYSYCIHTCSFIFIKLPLFRAWHGAMRLGLFLHVPSAGMIHRLTDREIVRHLINLQKKYKKSCHSYYILGIHTTLFIR